MRKKKEIEVPAPVTNRKRRSNLELAKLSSAHLRTIRKISEMAQVPMKRVFSDVIEVGIASVLSSYKPMIEMEEERKLRSERLKNLFANEQPISEPVGRGIAQDEDEPGYESSDITSVERPANEDPYREVGMDHRRSLSGPDDADVGPGQLPEADTYIGSVTPNGEIITDA